MYHEGLVVWLRHITLHFKVEISQQVRPNSLDLQISVTCTKYGKVHTGTDKDIDQHVYTCAFFFNVEIPQQVALISLDLKISVTCTEYDIVHRHIHRHRHRHDTETDIHTDTSRHAFFFHSYVEIPQQVADVEIPQQVLICSYILRA